MSYKKLLLLLCLGIFLSAERSAIAQSVTFTYTNSVQSWTVPCATQITITATGAQGGNNGGKGAQVIGTFSVIPGAVLNIVVGQQGLVGDGGQNGGGGGGTYVWNSGNDSLLVAAAGGGGYSTNGGNPPGQGSGTSVPTNGGGSGSGAGGTGGNGGVYGANTGHGADGLGGGGAGWKSNGGTNPGNFSEGEGQGGFYPLSLITPAQGGKAGNVNGAAGGYGGGGGSSGGSGASGGGGGYNGGGGGNAWSGSQWGSGGGGGSYNAGTNQTNTTGMNTGNGSVTITWKTAIIAVTDTAKVKANEITCNGQSGIAYAKATGVALSYIWTPTGQTTDTATGLSAGTYTVSVSSPCGGSASSSVTITQPANVITASASILANASCAGAKNGSATVTVVGVGTPYTYTWTPSGETTAVANGLSAGAYTVTVVNACAASATATVTITQPAPLAMSASTTANVPCYGESVGSAYSVAHSGTPPYNYNWAPSGGTLDTAVGLSASTYTVTLTDNNGCTGSAKTTITQPALLTISASTVTNVMCNGNKTGSTISTAAGGTTPYTYAWTGGQTTPNASGLKAGAYMVDITDAHGCSASASTSITQPTKVNVIQNSTYDSGSCTGSAWVVVTGGILPYTYAWSNGNTTYYIPDQCGTKDYCCIVTDGNGCPDTVCIMVYSVAGVGSVSGTGGKIEVYPNPTSGQLTITSSVANDNSVVEIYNVLGEKVYSTSLDAKKGGSTTVNLGNQPNGIYLYRVMSSENGTLEGEGKIVLTR